MSIGLTAALCVAVSFLALLAAANPHINNPNGNNINGGAGASSQDFKPMEIEYVYGCEGSTTPRRSTFECDPAGGDRITIRGRGFSPVSNTILLQNVATKEVLQCDSVVASRHLPTLIQTCILRGAEEGAVFDLKARSHDGKTAVLRRAVTIKAATANAAEEDNLRLLDFNDWETLGIGGLGKEFEELFRRAFSTRISAGNSLTQKLGIRHVKGVILHGPPGTGKTLIARKVAKLLNAKNVQIVNGPEIMSKFVGESEKNLRALFGDAEADFKKNGDQAGLHIIILDEVDAVLRHRGAGDDSAARAVYDGVTTQMLSYMDGFHSQNNLIIIGLTNRLDALDKALLRPGRFEVQIRIPLPDDEGRQQILRIHSKQIRDHGYLHEDVDFAQISRNIASFSGADVEGVTRSAVSFALQRLSKEDKDEEQFMVTARDYARGVKEILQTKGSSANTAPYFAQGIVPIGKTTERILDRVTRFANVLSRSRNQHLLRFVIQGKAGTGATALAALAARNTRFSFVTVVSPESLLGLSQSEKITRISQAFETAANVATACIVLDSIEDLVEFNPSRGTVNAVILHELSVLMNRDPALMPHQRNSKLMVILTTSSSEVLRMLSPSGFEGRERLRDLTKRDAKEVLNHYNVFATPEEATTAVQHLRALPIKKLLSVIEFARQQKNIDVALRPKRASDLTVASGAAADDDEDVALNANVQVDAITFMAAMREMGVYDDDPSSSPLADATSPGL